MQANGPLARARKRSLLTQAEVGRALGVTTQAVGMLEKQFAEAYEGERTLTPRAKERVAGVIALLDGQGKREAQDAFERVLALEKDAYMAKAR